MSFGYGVADAITLVTLAWNTFEGARRACGEHDDLTKEVSALHTVFEQLRSDLDNPDSLINLADKARKEELESHIRGCERHLRTIDIVLRKYNALSDNERSGQRLWQKIRFGNGEVKDLVDIRHKITTYTTAISMSLHLLSPGSQGRIERRLSRQGGDLTGIRESINLLLAKEASKSPEGSVMTLYSDDDETFWKSLRRKLVKDGYSSSVIRGHMNLIQDYVRELSLRGVLDDSKGRSRVSLAVSTNFGGRPISASAQQNIANSTKYNSVGISLPSPSVVESTELQSPLQPAAPSEVHTKQNSPVIFANISPDDTSSRETEEGDATQEICLPFANRISLIEDVGSTFTPPMLTSLNNSTNPEVTFNARSSPIQKLAPTADAVQPEVLLNLMERLTFLETLTRQQQQRLDATRSLKTSENQASPFIDLVVSENKNPLETSIDTSDAAKKAAKIRVDLTPLNIETQSQMIRSSYASLPDEIKQKKPIFFKDAVGRKFTFPYYLVQTWVGMEELIKQAFVHVNELGPHVAEGHYDLIALEGLIILPQVWESTVQPDLQVTMHMWPLPERPRGPPPLPPHFTRNQFAYSSTKKKKRNNSFFASSWTR